MGRHRRSVIHHFRPNHNSGRLATGRRPDASVRTGDHCDRHGTDNVSPGRRRRRRRRRTARTRTRTVRGRMGRGRRHCRERLERVPAARKRPHWLRSSARTAAGAAAAAGRHCRHGRIRWSSVRELCRRRNGHANGSRAVGTGPHLRFHLQSALLVLRARVDHLRRPLPSRRRTIQTTRRLVIASRQRP